jgi:hypothetical protein
VAAGVKGLISGDLLDTCTACAATGLGLLNLGCLL